MGSYDTIEFRYDKGFPGNENIRYKRLQTKDLDCSYLYYIVDTYGKLYRLDSHETYGNNGDAEDKNNWLFMSTINCKIFAYGTIVGPSGQHTHDLQDHRDYDLEFKKGVLQRIVDVTSEDRWGLKGNVKNG